MDSVKKDNQVSGSFSYELKLKVCRNDGQAGPGIIRFLDLIEKTGSMQAACKEMDMAYSKGWKIMRLAEQTLGTPLLIRTSGGSTGGGSVLTPEAHDFVDRYNKYLEYVHKAADEGLKLFF